MWAAELAAVRRGGAKPQLETLVTLLIPPPPPPPQETFALGGGEGAGWGSSREG